MRRALAGEAAEEGRLRTRMAFFATGPAGMQERIRRLGLYSLSFRNIS